MNFPADRPAFERPPEGRTTHSTAGACELCGKFQLARFEDWQGVRVGFCCLYDALDDADTVLLTSALHRYTGCPSARCLICEKARG